MTWTKRLGWKKQKKDDGERSGGDPEDTMNLALETYGSDMCCKLLRFQNSIVISYQGLIRCQKQFL